MVKQIGKNARFVFIILSLLGLIGCASLDQRQAKQIEKKLAEMYEGKTFEVLALGNRWGTLTNDTVTAHVREVKSDVVFIVKMNTKGEIVANSYPGSAVTKQLEVLINKNLAKEGITAVSLFTGYGGKEVTNLNPDIPLGEYISNYAPDYFTGYLLIKDSPYNTGKSFLEAFWKTYVEIEKTFLQSNVWIIPNDSFDEVSEKFSRLPEVDNSWFDDKNTKSFFKINIDNSGEINIFDKNGERNINENELDQFLQGGEQI